MLKYKFRNSHQHLFTQYWLMSTCLFTGGGRCKDNQQETFKAQCCTQYFQCSNKVVTLNNCPSNQVYRDNSQRCTPQTSADQNCNLSPACHPNNNVIITEGKWHSVVLNWFLVGRFNHCFISWPKLQTSILKLPLSFVHLVSVVSKHSKCL